MSTINNRNFAECIPQKGAGSKFADEMEDDSLPFYPVIPVDVKETGDAAKMQPGDYIICKVLETSHTSDGLTTMDGKGLREFLLVECYNQDEPKQRAGFAMNGVGKFLLNRYASLERYVTGNKQDGTPALGRDKKPVKTFDGEAKGRLMCITFRELYRDGINVTPSFEVEFFKERGPAAAAQAENDPFA